MEDKLPLIEGKLRDGCTEKSIYHSLGVSHTVWEEWKNEKMELAEIVKRTREFVDRTVENALLKRARGFEIEETEEIDSENSGITRKVKTKTFAPDTTAIIFWLKNRKPEEWNDKTIQEVNHSGSINFSKLSDEEIEKELKRLESDE